MKHAQLSSFSAAGLRWLICAGLAFCSLKLYGQQTQTSNNSPDITGSGKRGVIAVWASDSELGMSKMFQGNGMIGIGTSKPSTNLDVVGSINSSAGYNLGGQPFAFGANGSGNAFLGFAGNASSSGTGNLGAGFQALHANTSGSANVAAGLEALDNNTSGGANTAVGFTALFANTTGSNNTASGNGAMQNTTTGSNNAGFGSAALNWNVTGSFNTALGYTAGPDESSTNLTNATAIGAYAIVSQSNALVLGCTFLQNSCPSAVHVGIATATPGNILTIGQGAGHAIADGWDTYSSRRWKTNIETLQGALGKVEQLRGVSYNLQANGKHEIGVIAEEVGAVVPEVVSWDKNGKEAQGVDYSRLTALLIEATKEQQALIREQQEQLRVQQDEILRLGSQVKAVQARLKSSGRGESLVQSVKAQDRLVRQ